MMFELIFFYTFPTTQEAGNIYILFLAKCQNLLALYSYKTSLFA